ncbi:MAG: hypothetical protein AAFQ24_12045, partial [Pseudomonadota bacterium]
YFVEPIQIRMKKNRFFRWLPLAWRVPVIIIGVSAFSLLLYNLYANTYGGLSSSGARLINSALLTLGITLTLITRAMRHTEDENERWAMNVFFALFFLLFVFIGPVGEALRDGKKDAETKWVISNICSKNGKIKQDLLRECAAFKGQVCALGATPMYSCEVRLRKTLKLDLPDDQS